MRRLSIVIFSCDIHQKYLYSLGITSNSDIILHYPFVYFTIRTGHLVFWETPFATLPKSHLSKPVLP